MQKNHNTHWNPCSAERLPSLEPVALSLTPSLAHCDQGRRSLALRARGDLSLQRLRLVKQATPTVLGTRLFAVLLRGRWIAGVNETGR